MGLDLGGVGCGFGWGVVWGVWWFLVEFFDWIFGLGIGW